MKSYMKDLTMIIYNCMLHHFQDDAGKFYYSIEM